MALFSSSNPGIRGRVLPRFPARVQGTNGFTIVKANGVYTLQPDLGTLASLTSVAAGDRDNVWFFSWNSDTGVYSKTSFQALVDEVTGAGLDATLVAIAGLTPGANQGIYFTATDTAALFTLTSVARNLLDDTSATEMLGTLGISAYVQTLLNDADAATARATLGLRIKLEANLTLYVRSDGSDSNDGTANTAGGALRQISAALTRARDYYDRNGYQITIQAGSGTYTGIDFTGPFVGGGSIRILGDQTTPTNCIIAGGSSAGALFRDDVTVYISGFQITGINGLVAYGLASVTFDKIDFGTVTGVQSWATQAGQLEKIGNCTVSGGGANLIQASHGGRYRDSAGITSWTADVTYSVATAYVLDASSIVVTGTNAANTVGTSSASYYANGHTITGPQWSFIQSGTIQANGHHPPVSGFFPGSAIGIDGKCNVVNATYNLATASGTQDITGFGFDPTSCEINFSINAGTLGGVGYASRSGNQGCSTTTTDNAAVWLRNTSFAIAAVNAAVTASQLGLVSFITDGIRITWTKTGSPTGTLGITVKAQH